MKTRRRLMLLLVVLAAGAAFTLTFIFWDRTSTDLELISSPEPARLTVAQLPAEPPRAGLREDPDPRATLENCSFFEKWSSLEPSREHVLGLLEAIRPLAAHHPRCLPLEWLLAVLVAGCDGEVRFSDPERALLAKELAVRPRPPARARGNRIPWLGPEHLACLASSSLLSNSTLEEQAEIWGRLLALAFADRGSIFGAEPEVVEALATILAGWPIREDAWWQVLWEAMADDTSDRASIPARLGIVEALHGILPEEEWLDRVNKLASLGESRDALGGSTLGGIGLCLQRMISDERMAGLLAEPIGDSLRRSIILLFPDRLRWPHPDHYGISDAIRMQVRDLRDSPEFPHRLDILQNQWGLLGPVEAAQDLERFAFGQVAHTPDWGLDAAVRLHAALDALRLSSGRSGDETQVLESTREVIREWTRRMSPAELGQIVLEANRVFWSRRDPATNELRELLLAILGPHTLQSLPADLRAIVEGH